MASYTKNLLKQLPFYEKTKILRIKKFTNAKLSFIQNQNQIFLILPLICYQLLPLFFLNLTLNLTLNLILIQCL